MTIWNHGHEADRFSPCATCQALADRAERSDEQAEYEATTMPRLRCERPLPEGGYCSRTATRICSRVDAIRDWTYRCAPHAESMGAVWEVSAKLSQADLIMALTYWPPKHRSASREDAKRVLARAQTGTVSMEEKG